MQWAKKENGSLEVVPIYADHNSFKLTQTLCRGIASGFRAVVRLSSISQNTEHRDTEY